MQQQILHLLCTAGSCQLHFSGREHTLQAGCCMIAMASHVGHIKPLDDCCLLSLLLPAHEQVGLMPYGSYGTCGWLHLFMHPIFQLDGDALTILRRDFEDVAFRSAHTPEAYRQEAVLQSMRILYLDAMNAQPILSLGLRLGEGTGALCAFPILDSAIRMLNEMNNFENGKITKYF